MARASDLVPAVGRLGIGGAAVVAAALPREAHELKLVIELMREPFEGKLGERQV